MSFIRQMFGLGKKNEDYETILFNLSKDIQRRQLKLSELHLRERRSTFLVTIYTLVAWAAYVSLWYFSALPNFKFEDGKYIRATKKEKVFKALLVVVGPIIIICARSVVLFWFKKKADAEEKPLRELMKKRRDKFEEIKQNGNFYHICDLIQKYNGHSQRFPPRQAPPFTPQRPRGRAL